MLAVPADPAERVYKDAEDGTNSAPDFRVGDSKRPRGTTRVR